MFFAACESLEAIEWPEIVLLPNEFPLAWNITIHRLSSFDQSRVFN